MSESKLTLLWAALRAKCEAEVPSKGESDIEMMSLESSQSADAEMPTQGSQDEEMLSQEWSQPDEEMLSQDQEMQSQEPEVGDVVDCTGEYGEEVPSLALGGTTGPNAI